MRRADGEVLVERKGCVIIVKVEKWKMWSTGTAEEREKLMRLMKYRVVECSMWKIGRE